jgi:hypothetical protein
MTDKQLNEYYVKVNLDEATQLARTSAHKLHKQLAQTSRPQKHEGVRMLAEMQEWDTDDLPYMDQENYVKKTPKKFKDNVKFEKVSMSDVERKDYDREAAQDEASKWAKRAEHHTYMASTLA